MSIWAAAMLLAGVTGSAVAQTRDAGTLRQMFSARPGAGRSAEAPSVARFTAGDDRAFVLDRSGDTPLLKFEGDAEVWALKPAPGPRGDVIYKDDLGRQVLRASSLGGVTVFTPDRPSGLPAAAVGVAAALRPLPMSAVQLWRHLVRQSSRVSRALGRPIEFVAQEVDAGEEAIYADAATVTASTLAKAAPRMGTGALRKIGKVELVEGLRAAADVDGDAMQITLAPDQGLAGRPSSKRVMMALDRAD